MQFILVAKGKSGRLVVEVDPGLKRRLYSVLAIENLTFKQWLIDAIEQYLDEHEQPRLPGTTKSRGGKRS